jgi:hypothetical protein
MSSEINEKMDGSLLRIYEWIYQLSSLDVATSIKALKSIANQLDIDASVFNIHLEALTLSLIAKIHVFFAMEPPPIRLFKYIFYCLFTLLEKTDLPKVISYSSLNQIIMEIITRLCNGVGDDKNSTQYFTVMLAKLSQECTHFTFKSLINAASHEIDQIYPEIWVKMACKCFDSCIDIILSNEDKDQDDFENDIISGLSECETLIRSKGVEELKKSSVGIRLINSIRKFGRAVADQYPEILQRADVKSLLGNKINVVSL